MKKFTLKNTGDKTLRIMLEPWAEGFDVAAGDEVEIRADFGDGVDGLEIHHVHESFMVLFVPASTTVWKDGLQL